jgi:cell division protease FtsH
VKEASIPLPGEKKSAQVKYFQTVLPSFQGEGLLSQLKEKNVIITIEPAEQGLFWQMVIGFLPWVLIIGFWVLMTKRSQQVQAVREASLPLEQARPNCMLRKNRA